MVYFTWASEAAANDTPKPKRFYLMKWIELHTLPAFRDFVEWMRAEFDREAAAVDGPVCERAANAFGNAFKLEARFFDVAFEA